MTKQSLRIVITIIINEDTVDTAPITSAEKTEHEKNAYPLNDCLRLSFKKIPPFWPLKNLIAVNPLQGLEDLPIEEAFEMGALYFQQDHLPTPMQLINRESIKWLQVFFDEGQATIPMPLRKDGLYSAWRQLAIYDQKLHRNDKKSQEWLKKLPNNTEEAIANCLQRLEIKPSEIERFLTLMLTTLSGWSAYIKYRTQWSRLDGAYLYPISEIDYIAFRLIITCLLWPNAKDLLKWHSVGLDNNKLSQNTLEKIQVFESSYQIPLLKKLAAQSVKISHQPKAQLVFCIDVRSEPFRRALEKTGNYDTFGFAGFFGLPIELTNPVTGLSFASCPVLISPKHQVKESPCSNTGEVVHDDPCYQRMKTLKQIYQSLKYTFTTPLALVETLGIFCGAWMALRSFFPGVSYTLKTKMADLLGKHRATTLSFEDIPFSEQCHYAENALKMMGLTNNFAKLVVFCGHGSSTENNAYASSLDCGACGGRHGGNNARVLADILNQKTVKEALAVKGLFIPTDTYFIAAEHNTTTDEVILYGDTSFTLIQELQQDFEKARIINCATRVKKIIQHKKITRPKKHMFLRSQDWAQVRPEWGLAGNAAFIVGPRNLTESLDLEGRAFLHSYDWKQDYNGALLTNILTAPMVVAQWINTQYLFSTLDNVAFGGGNKITQNVTGKFAVMQGNASDLMTGLPFQSVYESHTQKYHQTLRLMTVVYAPCALINQIVNKQSILQKLFSNGWLSLVCMTPEDQHLYVLQRDLTWQNL